MTTRTDLTCEETLAELLSLNGRRVAVIVAGPCEGDEIIAAMYGVQQRAQPEDELTPDRLVFELFEGDTRALYVFEAAEFVSAGWHEADTGATLMIVTLSGAFEITPVDELDNDQHDDDRDPAED